MNILVFTQMYFAGKERVDLKLVEELRTRQHRVVHIAPGDDFRDYPSRRFPKTTECDPAFLRAGTRWVKSHLDVYRYIDQADVVVVGNGKGIQKYTYYAKLAGKRIVQHVNAAIFDLYCYDPDLYCISGKSVAQELRGIIDTQRLRVTGAVAFDPFFQVEHQTDRAQFCQKYNLDPEKKIACWCPCSPPNHNDYYKKIYQRVCEIIAAHPEYNLLIKGHPADYASYKTHDFYSPNDRGKKSWEILATGMAVAAPEDHYAAIRFSDVGLSPRSTVAYEFSLCRKPFIYINRQEIILGPQDLVGVIDLSANLPSAPGLHRFSVHENIRRLFDKGLLSTSGWEFYDQDKCFMFAGMDCRIEHLNDILTWSRYTIQQDDAYDSIIKDYFLKDDGKAYQRIADAIETLPVLARSSAARLKAARIRLSGTINNIKDKLFGILSFVRKRTLL